jgi:hypothetical protein
MTTSSCQRTASRDRPCGSRTRKISRGAPYSVHYVHSILWGKPHRWKSWRAAGGMFVPPTAGRLFACSPVRLFAWASTPWSRSLRTVSYLYILLPYMRYLSAPLDGISTTKSYYSYQAPLRSTSPFIRYGSLQQWAASYHDPLVTMW